MISRRGLLIAGLAAPLIRPLQAQGAWPEMTPVADFDWSYLADTVMGGVSEGQARIEDGALRLTGRVSTANRGGFIQARTGMPDGLPAGVTALRLRVRGNGERYFVHLRTVRTRLPWQYYQQGFETGTDWAEVLLPLSGFLPSGRMMAGAVRPGEVRSIGLVAYGRDHVADVSLSALGAL
ncbi:NADH ubiquinone oxidoreductase [Rhodobacterales bacterium HKCCSP123]|nr:NADH ubiquinone oxidoreductase [Rhodobacterales bacterium HKCCSP123]